MEKLRLLIEERCGRDCAGCCNKDFDLAALPVCKDFTGYDMIMLTGGEPMLDPINIEKVIADIREQDAQVPIYLYTATTRYFRLRSLLEGGLDGVTLTLHTHEDVDKFNTSRFFLDRLDAVSMRLNVFKDAVADLSLDDGLEPYWTVKRDIEWLENCPLPADEVFMRYTAADREVG